MNVNEIRNKCLQLLKKTSFWSAEHFHELDKAFERNTSDMRVNFEFFFDKVKDFCYERGQLLCEWEADETQVIFLVVNNILYRIAMDIVMRDENLIRRADGKYINSELKNLLIDVAFDEIGGIYADMHKRHFGIFNLTLWNGG